MKYLNDVSNLETYNGPVDRMSLGRGKVNSHVSHLFNLCKTHKMYILNGRVGNDRNVGKPDLQRL